MEVTLDDDFLVAELSRRLDGVCVCQARLKLRKIESIYLKLKEHAEKDIPFSCIE